MGVLKNEAILISDEINKKYTPEEIKRLDEDIHNIIITTFELKNIIEELNKNLLIIDQLKIENKIKTNIFEKEIKTQKVEFKIKF